MRVPARGQAGGKVILLGEHVVVYGRPALASGLPLGLAVELRAGPGPAVYGEGGVVVEDARPAAVLERAATLFGLDPAAIVAEVHTQLPPGRGLGSSAALVVAMLRACAAAAGRRVQRDDELALGRQLEAMFHGTPSGIDPAAAALGGCFRFVRGEPPALTPIRLAAPLPLVVAFGDRPRSTQATVAAVRERWLADRPRCERLFDAVEALVARGVHALERGDLGALGACFAENQAVLDELGVSTPEIAGLVARARAAGAFGAKLTGGGGGGAVIAVGVDAPALAAALARDGVRAFVVELRSVQPEAG
mgnify:CR=1 FL=1